MKSLTIYEGPQQENAEGIAVESLNIGRCKGCMRCRFVKGCIVYSDDAQKTIPKLLSADHLILRVVDGTAIRNLLERTLFAIASSKGKTYTVQGNSSNEITPHIRRILDWCGYQEQRETNEAKA